MYTYVRMRKHEAFRPASWIDAYPSRANVLLFAFKRITQVYIKSFPHIFFQLSHVLRVHRHVSIQPVLLMLNFSKHDRSGSENAERHGNMMKSIKITLERIAEGNFVMPNLKITQPTEKVSSFKVISHVHYVGTAPCKPYKLEKRLECRTHTAHAIPIQKLS